jgi:3-isopropylmalate dehydrogenase
VAMILSVAMMLEWLGNPETVRGAALIHRAVERVLADPSARTKDLRGNLTTSAMGERIVSEVAA